MRTDAESPISREYHAASDTLVLLFGGIGGNLGTPPFEFVRAAKILSCSRLFLRDRTRSWYHRGLPGIGPNLEAVAEFLRAEITSSRASRVVFVGNSMGGYAALMFCAFLGIGRVVCFSPQTFIDPANRRMHGDTRWEQPLAALHRAVPSSDAFDLAPWLARFQPDITADVFVSIDDRLDFLHAERLGAFPNVTLHRVAAGGHALVRQLRDNGTLASILGKAISDPSGPGA